MNKIHYSKPSITSLEVEYATRAAQIGWGERCYDCITDFEEKFKQHLGVKYAHATSSCTGALHMGYAAIGIKPGDEVILGDINWLACAAAITYLGAKPVFVDVLPDTWCLDPIQVEAAITPQTKAIVAVHLYGNLCEMNKLQVIAAGHNLVLVEDAAEAIGAVYHGKRAGSIGNFGVFSFHGTKTLTTGEGGMFVTNNGELYEKVVTLNNHGRPPQTSTQFWAEMIGYKYRMANVQAAIGCAQMERIEELIAKKREVFLEYQRLFADMPDITMNPEPAGTVNGHWMPAILFGKSYNFDREKLLTKFKENNIDGRCFFWPLSWLPMFDRVETNPVAYDITERAVNLPSYHDITEEEQKRVCDVIKSFICHKKH
ncbi:MAG: DegT/DnrJ/EryC1/StrS family aminotransferase [Planctomycetaceae bacterium]|nr:DegT/DnrJ/EryC1/StrS family aminotransferase [Planctomycetaceae bacterium]